ncbi:hypothetical protein Hdeb2414_s0026g00678581 [Helianthus debilis subsp. tardiflorus]
MVLSGISLQEIRVIAATLIAATANMSPLLVRSAIRCPLLNDSHTIVTMIQRLWIYYINSGDIINQ